MIQIFGLKPDSKKSSFGTFNVVNVQKPNYSRTQKSGLVWFSDSWVESGSQNYKPN